MEDNILKNDTKIIGKKTFKELHDDFNVSKQLVKNKLMNRQFQGGDMICFGYDKFYDKIFDSLRNKPLIYLEIGILQGLKMFIFSKFLTKALFYGIDINIDNFNNYPHDNEFKKRVKDISLVNTNNKKSTDSYKNKIKVKYDIIIDDGDHNPLSMINTFNSFYEKLNDSGIYIIEDVRKPSRLKKVSKFFNKKGIKYEFMIDPTQFERFDAKEKGNGIIVIYKKDNL